MPHIDRSNDRATFDNYPGWRLVVRSRARRVPVWRPWWPCSRVLSRDRLSPKAPGKDRGETDSLMDRRRFVVGTITLLGAPLAAEAQARGKLPRVGYVQSEAAALAPLHEAFLVGLRERGWIHGQNVVIERRTRDEEIADLVRLNLDVIVLPEPVPLSGGAQVDNNDTDRHGRPRVRPCREGAFSKPLPGREATSPVYGWTSRRSPASISTF